MLAKLKIKFENWLLHFLIKCNKIDANRIISDSFESLRRK